MLSLKEAAEQTGKTKPAILKAIHKGRISAHKNENGEWEIDPAELFRVYRKPVQHKPDTGNPEETGLHKEIDGLQEKIRKLHQENQELKADKEQLRSDMEEWREQAKAARLLLTDQRATTSQKAAESRLSRIWSVLRGKP